jgi:hypothetical protein
MLVMMMMIIRSGGAGGESRKICFDTENWYLRDEPKSGKESIFSKLKGRTSRFLNLCWK